MSKVVFILGAGASKQAGAPLMADFLDIASDLLFTGKVDANRTHFETVLKTIGGLQATHSKAQLDLNNIESIFTALELGRIIQKVPGIDTEKIPSAIASLKEVIVKTIEQTMHFPLDGSYIKAPAPYEDFANLIKFLREKVSPAQTVSVLTFNYDFAADIALFRAGLGPNYVIDGPGKPQNEIELLKLHGSLNWATETKSRIIRPFHPSAYLQYYRATPFNDHSRVILPISSQLVEYFERLGTSAVEVDVEPVIVPPSWNKADYHSTLSNVWAAAAKHLGEAESIFIVGYSLPNTDSFFRHLFALGSVGQSTLRRIVVFNPDSTGETDGRFRSLLGPGSIARYEYVSQTFAQSISTIRQYFPNHR